MSIKRKLNTWRSARQTAYELNLLSTRELNDMGIERSKINEIAMKAARANAI